MTASDHATNRTTVGDEQTDAREPADMERAIARLAWTHPHLVAYRTVVDGRPVLLREHVTRAEPLPRGRAASIEPAELRDRYRQATEQLRANGQRVTLERIAECLFVSPRTVARWRARYGLS